MEIRSPAPWRTSLAEDSLIDFCQQAWPVVEPATPLIWNWHLSAICDHLNAITTGQIRNLIINIPPGFMKSLAVCVFWPAWEWIKTPHRRWLFASYSGSLSVRDSLRCRRLIASDWYQARWSDEFAITDDQDAKIKFENDKTGFRIATSVGGTGTGERANRVIADDPHNVKERESDVKRASVLDWWDQAFSNRQCDYQTDARVVIHQRVHEKDLTGHLLARDSDYIHLCLPTEFEPSRRCITNIRWENAEGTLEDGWKDPRITENDLLFPQRFGPSEVAEAKLTLGPTGYAAQHQQSPVAAGGNRFKSRYFRYWKDAGDLYQLIDGDKTHASQKKDCWRFATMDPAGTDGDQNDHACYTVIQVWDVTPESDMLLVHQYREQVETPEVVNAALDIARRFSISMLAVEKNGLGLGVVQTILRSGVAVYAINATGSKEARSETAEIRLAAGKVYFPHESPYLVELERELLLFPNGEYCDQVDALSHSAAMVQERHGAPQSLTEPKSTANYPVPAGHTRRAF